MTTESPAGNADGSQKIARSAAWWLRKGTSQNDAGRKLKVISRCRNIARIQQFTDVASFSRGAMMIKAIIESIKYYWQFLWNHEADDQDCSEYNQCCEKKPTLVYTQGFVYSDRPIEDYAECIDVDIITRYPYFVGESLSYPAAKALAKGLGLEIRLIDDDDSFYNV